MHLCKDWDNSPKTRMYIGGEFKYTLGNCLLLGYYTMSSGNFLIDISGLPIGAIFKNLKRKNNSLWILYTCQDETDRLFWNVDKKLPLLTA